MQTSQRAGSAHPALVHVAVVSTGEESAVHILPVPILASSGSPVGALRLSSHALAALVAWRALSELSPPALANAGASVCAFKLSSHALAALVARRALSELGSPARVSAGSPACAFKLSSHALAAMAAWGALSELSSHALAALAAWCALSELSSHALARAGPGRRLPAGFSRKSAAETYCDWGMLALPTSQCSRSVACLETDEIKTDTSIGSRRCLER